MSLSDSIGNIIHSLTKPPATPSAQPGQAPNASPGEAVPTNLPNDSRSGSGTKLPSGLTLPPTPPASQHDADIAQETSIESEAQNRIFDAVDRMPNKTPQDRERQDNLTKMALDWQNQYNQALNAYDAARKAGDVAGAEKAYQQAKAIAQQMKDCADSLDREYPG